ncbi:MAG: hypothetical protein M1402_01695 [Candidatus Thermoplasmatota archaeon]|nr:hypothetical protein [Candidatus Thermoplasmatota archaeon]
MILLEYTEFIILILSFISALISVYWRRTGYIIIIIASVLLSVSAFTLHSYITYFALIASISWIIVSVFSISYSKDYGKWITPLFDLTIAGMVLILFSESYLIFIVGFEIMTMPAYVTILKNRSNHAPSFIFMAFGELSTMFLILGAVISMVSHGGSLSFVNNSNDYVLLFFSIGCMLKMGIMPFMISEWLPIAHGSAPANDSAIFSGTMTLMGVYGIYRVMLLSPASMYLGLFLMFVGAMTVFFSSLYAYVSQNMKVLGGFSTMENNGAILCAMGLYVSVTDTILREFLLSAIIIFAMAHSIAKSGLFLSIGSTRSEYFGEKSARKRGHDLGTLLIVMSLSGLFPTIGGLAVWMLLESFFMGAYIHGIIGIASISVGSVIALAEGFGSAAMLKLFYFSGGNNVENKVNRKEKDVLLFTGIILVALFLISTLLILPEYVAGLPSVLVFNGFTVESSVTGSDFGLVSPVYVFSLVALFSLIAFALFGRPRGRVVPRWEGGITTLENYTSSGYSNNIRIMLRSILRTKISEDRISVNNIFWSFMVFSGRAYRKFGGFFGRKFMNSSVSWYMIYMIIAFIFVLFTAALL